MKKPSLRRLYSELCGTSAPEFLNDRRVVLVLDRSLSPAGARKLRDARTRPHAGATTHPWPNPGVYSIPELSERILRAYEAQIQRRLYPRESLSPLQQISVLMESGLVRSPHQALRTSRECVKLFAPLGVSFEDWRGVLEALESDDDPEFGDWTKKILAYLQLEATALREKRWLSPWSLVREAIELLSQNSLQLPWDSITERPSGADAVEFVVPEISASHPLEKKWLDALARQAPLHFVAAAAREASSPSVEWNKSQSDFTDAAIYWFSFDPLPSSSEAAELLPGSALLDAAEAPTRSSKELERALFLAADFCEKSQPSSHPFLRGPQFLDILRREGFLTTPSLEKNWSYGDLRESCLRRRPELAAAWPETPLSGNSSEWIKVFSELGYFEGITENSPGLPHARLSASGVPLLTLGDLGFTGQKNIVLWGTSDLIEKLCDPQSPEVLSQRSFPAKLQSLLEAHGYRLPDPSQEAEARGRWIQELGDHLSLMPATRLTEGRLTPLTPFAATIDLDKRKPSPSALESWVKCSMRFTLERLLRLQDSEEWDALSENPLKLGSWVHRCLEIFFENPDWENPRAQLAQIFLAARNEFFEQSSTPSYLSLLETRGDLFAERLERHIREFEEPLARLRNHATPLREFKVEGVAFGQHFRGIVDRVDILPGNKLLLWDYKTGAVRESKPESQFKQGRFQWFIYRELLNAQGLGDVVGGGYLNPLDPHKSALFLYEQRAGEFNNELGILFGRNGHSTHGIESTHEDKVATALESAVTTILQEMRSGQVRAQPLKPTDCVRCTHLSVCGRPFMERSTGND